ncbi:hypothetical protein ATANTOWER_027233 [Ataeniobius toweri]|uniref:Uncharacterized protein n=1 Tax=Ataeniobius toweri TaxID=208326 RepID=A0ABU7BKX7_9TELE|nr:hypothetical protein [Ataeniobius toweri]
MRQLVRGRLQGAEGEGLIDKMSKERDLEIMVLSDKNNLKRSHCLLLWGEGTFHLCCHLHPPCPLLAFVHILS